jgi:hypothetical protein
MGGIGSDTAAACLIVGVTRKGEDFGLTDGCLDLCFDSRRSGMFRVLEPPVFSSGQHDQLIGVTIHQSVQKKFWIVPPTVKCLFEVPNTNFEKGARYSIPRR